MPDKYIPELREASQRAGLDWDKFQLTDNSCPPHPPRKNPIQELGDDIVLVRACAKPIVDAHLRQVLLWFAPHYECPREAARQSRLLLCHATSPQSDRQSWGRASDS